MERRKGAGCEKAGATGVFGKKCIGETGSGLEKDYAIQYIQDRGRQAQLRSECFTPLRTDVAHQLST